MSTLDLSTDQLKCLASPGRAEVVRVLDAHGPASVKELADRLGQPPTRLYHHLARLRSAGLVRACKVQNGRPAHGSQYRLVADRLSSAKAVRTENGREALALVARRFLSAASRRFQQMVDSPSTVVSGDLRNLSIRQIQVNLDNERMAMLNADLDALIDRYSKPGDAAHTIVVTMVVTPGR